MSARADLEPLEDPGVPQGSSKPEWIDELVSALGRSRMPEPDSGSKFRQWVGLAIGSGFLVTVFYVLVEIGAARQTLEVTAGQTVRIDHKLDAHIEAANEGNRQLADILRTIEGRTGRLEGLQERTD